MKAAIRTLLVLAFLGLLAVAARGQQKTNEPPQSWSPHMATNAYERGKFEARRDIQRNILIQRMDTDPPPWIAEYRETLRRHYRVQVYVLPPRDSADDLRDNVRGYNEVALAEIERRFGKGVLDRAAKEAEKTFEKRGKRP